MTERLFSNEIVFRGHPDKVCDQIAGAILRAYMDKDSDTRAGIEVAGGKGKIFLTGEVTSRTKIDIKGVVRSTLKKVGYEPDNYKIIDNIGRQSPDIARGVDVGGAGDQGMMFGYACDDTVDCLPTAMLILSGFARWYDALRSNNPDVFYSDGKAQITGIYDKNFRLKAIKDFVISYQNSETDRKVTDEKIVCHAEQIARSFGIDVQSFHVNPTGKFQIGGFEADAGITGRKLLVDAYHSFGAVGGGNMNGKDPTKVDFSGAHMARKLACELLKQYKLRWCQVQISYSIGLARPLGIYADSNIGALHIPQEWYERCTPANIIKELNLINADFEKLARFGHFPNQWTE